MAPLVLDVEEGGHEDGHEEDEDGDDDDQPTINSLHHPQQAPSPTLSHVSG